MTNADLDLAWTEGYVAGYAVQPMRANPYHRQPKLSDVWVTGWREGRTDELQAGTHSPRRIRDVNTKSWA